MGELVVTDESTIGDRYRLQIRADTRYQVDETSEGDNIWFTEYILAPIHKTIAAIRPSFRRFAIRTGTTRARERTDNKGVVQGNNTIEHGERLSGKPYPYVVVDPGERGLVQRYWLQLLRARALLPGGKLRGGLH